jgi:rod shape-determining protein MreD
MRLDYPKPIVKPTARHWLVVSFVISYLVEWMIGGYPRWMPDFVLIFLCHWCLRQPESLNIPKSFLLGMLMDAVTFSPFGQHILGYSLTAFILLSEQRRLLMVHFWQQGGIVAGIHLLHYTLMACTRWIFGGIPFPDVMYWLPVLSGTCVWIVISWSLQTLRQEEH